jgi:hypothetical protein
VGEFSGIDSQALQGMTNSFKGDKDGLRSSVGSIKSDFDRYGLDTSSLSELTGICGWLDDQVPMLTRRYHLAIAADKPYPGHKGMVSIDESMVGTTAQSRKDGKSLADQYNKSLDSGDQPSEDLFAALQAHADDADYLKAFYGELGPQRMELLTNEMAGSPYGRYGDHPDQINHDRDVLAKTFGTYTKVAFEGQSAQQKQAGWNKWFDRFSDPTGSFRPDYLVSLLPGGSQDKDFLVALGDRVYGKDPQKSGYHFLGASGTGGSEFAKDHLTQLFNAIGANPEASGEWMDHNYDQMQKMIYPGLVTALNEPQSRADAFVKMMHAGTIDLKSTDEPLAEKLTARIMMDNWRHQQGDEKQIHPYDPIDAYYGQLVTANWSDMVYGITSPVGDLLYGADPDTPGFTTKMAQWDQKAFLAGQDPNHPGLELGAPLWQALLNESARNSTAAGQESALFDSFRMSIINEVGSNQAKTTLNAEDYRMMQRGLMMSAYSKAFTYAEGSIEEDADTWAAGVNSARDTMIDWGTSAIEAGATGGESAILDLGTDKAKELGDTAKGLMVDYAKGLVHVQPEDAPGLASRYKAIDAVKLDDTWQKDYRDAANAQLTLGGYDKATTPDVYIYPKVNKLHPEQTRPTEHVSGDPSQYWKGNSAAKFTNADGSVVDPAKMTPRQRTAYGNWLSNPAVGAQIQDKGFTQMEQFKSLG